MSENRNVIAIDASDAESLKRALNTEWLLTNGLGGYSMGTLLGVNTRRYHGLLVAAKSPPVERIIALHSIIEQLIAGDRAVELSTQQFGEQLMMHPNGYRCLREVICEPNCRVAWQFEADGVQVTRTITPLNGRNGISLHYLILGANHPMKLRLRPLMTMRDFHWLSHGNGDIGTAETDAEGIVRFRIGDAQLRWFGQAQAWRDDPQWWRNFAYQLDHARGQEFLEDQWSAGYFDCDVRAGAETRISFALTLGSVIPARVPPIEMVTSPQCDPNIIPLHAAAEQFIVQRRAGDEWATSVIAGYPWFGDWGRDTMIALPGLMLCTNRIAEACSCLMMFARHINNGLIPNLFDERGGAAHYNTVDAPLWFVHAVHALWRSGRKMPGLLDSHGELVQACRRIIEAYRNGTDFNIRMDHDGLICAGDASTQLTWMDAKRDGVVFTPRNGKAVEINALWFNALRCLAELTDNDMERRDFVALSETVASSFRTKFWCHDRHCLYDVIGNHQLRPNQIFAVSLPFSPLEKDQQRAVVKIVGDRLLTPFGLRTLDRDDPEYRGRYEGNLFERDRAYHNGTVWPWLIGPYCEALLRVNDFNSRTKRKVQQIIQPLLDEMRNISGGRCFGQIAEVYDGDPPHNPSGCPAQAWSVAEVLRISKLVERNYE